MYLDPMAITLNVHDDHNSLKVPSISPMDGRMIRERLHSDSQVHERNSHRSALSSPTPSLLDDQPYDMKRPVSDQHLHMNHRNRKEKAVSWHSKIPTSTQTLGCVEGVNDDGVFSDTFAQSQPLLGTLESKSARKHICRHTYSVRQVRSPTKDCPKSRYLRRCVSSGTDRQKFREKYLLLRPTNKIKDCSSPVTMANEAHLAAQLNISKQNSLDDAKSEDMSLIDWAEDEMLCDEEVGNITGLCEDEEDDIKPTLTQMNTNSDFRLNVGVDNHIGGDKTHKYTDLDGQICIHSNSEKTDKTPCDETLKCDQRRSNYADRKSSKIDYSSLDHDFNDMPETRCKSALPQEQSTPQNLLDVPIPADPPQQRSTLMNSLADPAQQRSTVMNSLADHLKCDNSLRVGPAALGERRPPLQTQTGESHL